MEGEEMNMIMFKEILDKEGVIFSFSGTISQGILSSIAETIEKELHITGVPFFLIQNIFCFYISLHLFRQFYYQTSLLIIKIRLYTPFSHDN